MAKWNASVGLQLSIDYDDIEADTQEEAEDEQSVTNFIQYENDSGDSK